mgnify:CR=1 FL=1
MIDNFEAINKMIYWPDDGSIVHVTIVQRSKDGHPRATRYIQDFYIKSESDFEFMYPAIKVICNEYNARAYINPNPKYPEHIIYKIIELCVAKLKNKHYGILDMFGHCADKAITKHRKIWMIDIDERHDEETLNTLINLIRKCKSNHNDPIIDILPTVNGWHIMTNPFSIDDLGGIKLEINKNSSTLLYYP